MSASTVHPRSMSVDEFLAWSEEQGDSLHELIGGEVVGMAPERVAHAERKFELAVRLRAGLLAAKLPCQTFVDGVGVATDERSVFIADILVRCGERLDGQALVVPDPLIIVEVLSPSARAVDAGVKLEAYSNCPASSTI